jgi:hypothetical protein
MIKHVVMFKFRDDKPENKKNQLLEVKRALDLLPEYIPEIRTFEVGINSIESARAYDLVIVSDFDTIEALDVYRDHPSHLDVIEIIAKYKESAISVDYETE